MKGQDTMSDLDAVLKRLRDLKDVIDNGIDYMTFTGDVDGLGSLGALLEDIVDTLDLESLV